MEVFVRRIYRHDQQQVAICFRGRKFANCVVVDKPLRVWTMDLREAEKAPIPLYRGKPDTATRMAKEMKRLGGKNGITLAAERLIAAVLDGSSLTEDDIDVKPSENVTEDPPPKATRAVRRKAAESSNDLVDPPPAEEQSRAPRGNLVAELSAKYKIAPKDARKALRKAGMHAPYSDAAKVEEVLAKVKK